MSTPSTVTSKSERRLQQQQGRTWQSALLRWEILLVALIVIVTIVNARISPFFLQGSNLSRAARDFMELGIMIPLHFAAGVLLWRKQAWGYLMAILLAFAASMTFIALSIAMTLLYLSYDQGSVPDMVITMAIAVVATAVSLVAFSRVGNRHRDVGERIME